MEAFGEHERDERDGEQKPSRSLPTTVQIGTGVPRDLDDLSQTIQQRVRYPGGKLHVGLAGGKER